MAHTSAGAFFFAFRSLWSDGPVILFDERHRSGLFGGVATASPPFLVRGPRSGWCLFLIFLVKRLSNSPVSDRLVVGEEEA